MAKETKKTGSSKGFQPLVDKKYMQVRIEGATPLVVHAWAQKALVGMLAKQRKHPKGGREVRDPEQEYLSAKYVDIKGNDAILSSAIKNAMVTACSSDESMTKVLARQAFFVYGVEDMERPALIFDKENDGQMRDDMVHLGGAKNPADIRFRPCYYEWEADVIIEYNARVISKEQVLNLLALAGYSVGIFEWRPERDGDLGRFDVGKIDDLKERPKWDKKSLYLRKKETSVWKAIQAIEAGIGVSGSAAMKAKKKEADA